MERLIEIKERCEYFRECNYDVECGWYVDDVSYLLGVIEEFRKAEEQMQM